jgi:hypothetical protein
MANTSYTSIVINTTPKEIAAYDALAILFAHLRDRTGGYTLRCLSVVFDQGTNIITITFNNPLPAGQVARYNLTLV